MDQEPWTFEAIGTHWEIRFPEELTNEETRSLRERVSSRIEEYDATYSRFRPDSLVMQMAENAGTYTLPTDAPPLIRLYFDLYELTDGAVTPLIGQVLADAGYDENYSFTERELRTPKPLHQVLQYQHPELTLSEPALLDFGAAGKGYLVDIIANLIEATGGGEYLINAGGDIRLRSDEPVRIGLEHPGDESLVIGVAQLTEGSICGSAGNRRAWGAYHHIMDPNTLRSAEGIRAVWVAADEARIADGLTTALFFVPPYELEFGYTFEYLIVRDDYSLAVSDGFPAELFT